MLIKKFQQVGGSEGSGDFLKSIYQHFFQNFFIVLNYPKVM